MDDDDEEMLESDDYFKQFVTTDWQYFYFLINTFVNDKSIIIIVTQSAILEAELFVSGFQSFANYI